MGSRDRVLGGPCGMCMREPGGEPLVERLDRNSDGGPERLDECIRLDRLRSVLTAQRDRHADDDPIDLLPLDECGDPSQARLGPGALDDVERSGKGAARVRDRDAGPRRAVVEGEDLHERRILSARNCGQRTRQAWRTGFEPVEIRFISVPMRAHSVRLARGFGRNGECRTRPRRKTVDRRLRPRLRIALLATVAALATCITGTASAAPTELFFSEYVEGSSNNKALEIYNGTGAPVTLTGAYDVQIFANGSPTATATIPLTGSIPNGDVFVLARSTAVAAVLTVADQTTTNFLYNGNDAVALRNGGTIVDVIGQIGTDPGVEWGTGDTSTLDKTLRRKAAVQAGDPNGADVFDPASQWDGFPIDTFDGLGSHSLSGGGGRRRGR